MSELEKGQKVVITREQVTKSKHNDLVDYMDRAKPPVELLDGYVRRVEGDNVWLSIPKIDQQGLYSFSHQLLQGSVSDPQAKQSDMKKQ